ncbi:hypothetical protein RR48_05773 [Papilio machaon]|uniref:Uncharacterized protein n=1 Tax=Papilio machaon TaxID=76193 RepID=A0A0N1IA59_PAPMA|nr:hypothetical protein RR48_05773 [Papilio machaon]
MLSIPIAAYPPSAQAHAAASVSGSRAMAPAAASVVLFRVAVAASRGRLSHHKSASIHDASGLSSWLSSNFAPILFKAMTAPTAFAHRFLMTYLFSFVLVTCSSVQRADWINHGCLNVAEAERRSL